jgi:hypothetical protein
MGSPFLKVETFEGPRQEVITDVRVGSYDKPVLYLASGDRLSLNATNVRVLVGAYGRDSRDWSGKVVELRLGKTQYKGVAQDSILVKPISPVLPLEQRRKPEPEPAESIATDLDDEVIF